MGVFVCVWAWSICVCVSVCVCVSLWRYIGIKFYVYVLTYFCLCVCVCVCAVGEAVVHATYGFPTSSLLPDYYGNIPHTHGRPQQQTDAHPQPDTHTAVDTHPADANTSTDTQSTQSTQSTHTLPVLFPPQPKRTVSAHTLDQTSTTCEVALVHTHTPHELYAFEESMFLHPHTHTQKMKDEPFMNELYEIDATGNVDPNTQRFTRKQKKPSHTQPNRQQTHTQTHTQPPQRLAYWQRTCASAVFGQQGEFEVVAALMQTPEDDKFLCSTVNKQTHTKATTRTNTITNTHTDADAHASEEGTDHPTQDPESVHTHTHEQKHRSRDDVFGMPWKAHIHDAHTPTDAHPTHADAHTHPNRDNSNDEDTNTINPMLIVDRGACMFEEKAQAAEAIGASALIVANTEVRL
jgi:hypothetical protein